MEKITKLIKTLSPREIRLYYKYAELSGKKRNNLKIKLFEIARNNPEISDIEAAKLINSPTGAAFSMLKSRLYHDVLKVLSVDIDSSTFFSKSHWVRYSIHLLMTEYFILDNRNLLDHSFELLRKAEQLAKKYELPTLNVLVNEILINSKQVHKGPTVYARFKDNIFKDIEFQTESILAQDYFKQLLVPGLYSANKSKSQVEVAKLATENLGEITKKNPSVRIAFYYLRSQLEYTELTQDFKSNLKYAKEFLGLVNGNLVLKSSDNLGGAHIMLSLAYLHLGEYNKSIEHSIEASNYFFKEGANSITQKGLLFCAQIGNKDYTNGEATVDSLRNSKFIKRGSFNYSRWLYYDANIKFLNKDHKSALNLLNRHSFLKSDRSGWRLGYKILEMMCIVELHHYDWLPYRLETFRKLLSDIKKESTARPKLILKLLNRLVKENFDFDLTTRKMQAEFDLLQSNSGEYYCYPLGYEVIRFDVWWAGKMKHAPGEGPAQKKRKRNAKA